GVRGVSAAADRAGARGAGVDPDTRQDALLIVRRALEEDLRYGPDATSVATVPAGARAVARMVTRQDGVVAGLPLIEMVATEVLGEDARVVLLASDGDRVAAGDAVAEITAPALGLLTMERTMLNLVCHLSGIATATREWADALEGTRCAVRDTRKTLPACGCCRSTRCGAGAASITDWGWATPSSSRTTTSSPPAGCAPPSRRSANSSRACRARSRSIRSSSWTRCSRRGWTWCSWTTSRCGRPRSPCSAATRSLPARGWSPAGASLRTWPPTTRGVAWTSSPWVR